MVSTENVFRLRSNGELFLAASSSNFLPFKLIFLGAGLILLDAPTVMEMHTQQRKEKLDLQLQFSSFFRLKLFLSFTESFSELKETRQKCEQKKFPYYSPRQLERV